MDKIYSDDAVERMTQMWFDKSHRGQRIPSDFSFENHGKEKKETQKTQAPSEFSDEDIDKILKANEISITQKHRLNARFLLRRHFTIQKDMFKVIDTVVPNSLLKGHFGEAFVAAASKLPIDEIAVGFNILLQTIESDQSSVVSQVKDLIELIKDLISETYNLKTQLIEPELIRSALSEFLSEWDPFLEDEKVQLRWMIERKMMIRKMLSHVKLAQNLKTVLENQEITEDLKFLNNLGASVKKADVVMKILLSDAILSRYDAHHHLADHGSCYSVGTLMNGQIQPARLWVHDQDGDDQDTMDVDRLVLFFRWHTDDLGIVEAELITKEDDLNITFASANKDVSGTLNDEAHRLEERLRAQGYEAKLEPCVHVTKINDEETKIENISIEGMHHLDAKA